MSVSKRLRYEILRRDNHTCRYCGASAPDVHLTVDHVIPVALGGTDDPTNLVAACADCNAGKSASSPDAALVADVALDALRWGRAMEWAAAEQARQLAEVESYRSSVLAIWSNWTYDLGDGRRGDFTDDLPMDWSASADQFRRAGISLDEVRFAVNAAMSNPTVKSNNLWRYTCGVIWRRLEQRQELAKSKLRRDEIAGFADAFALPPED